MTVPRASLAGVIQWVGLENKSRHVQGVCFVSAFGGGGFRGTWACHLSPRLSAF